MTILYVVLAAIVALIVLYAVWGRAWLKRQPWSVGFFAWIEPIEVALFKKSETILVGRLLWVGGLLVTLYDFAAAFISTLDLTPVTTRLFDLLQVPPDMRSVATTAFITAMGLLINWLRKRTTKPLEVVAVKSTDLTREAAQAIAAADVAKENAVAAVQEAKAA